MTETAKEGRTLGERVAVLEEQFQVQEDRWDKAWKIGAGCGALALVILSLSVSAVVGVSDQIHNVHMAQRALDVQVTRIQIDISDIQQDLKTMLRGKEQR